MERAASSLIKKALNTKRVESLLIFRLSIQTLVEQPSHAEREEDIRYEVQYFLLRLESEDQRITLLD